MSHHAQKPDPVALFEHHLRAQYCEEKYPDPKANPPSYLKLKSKPGKFDIKPGKFDMEDKDELPFIENLQPLHCALEDLKFLATEWKTADTEAVKCQARHKHLTRVALITGFGAIILALVQLALKSSFPNMMPLTVTTVIIEAILLVGCIFSFVYGNRAGSDLKWLAWRHRAERLRMLKFRALGQPLLWEGKQEQWKQWLADEIESIPQVQAPGQSAQAPRPNDKNSDPQPKYLDRKTMVQWSEDDNSEPFQPVAGPLSTAPDTVQVFGLYYRYKRLIYQRAYFAEKGRGAAETKAVKIREYRKIIFYTTIAFVLLHFSADILHSLAFYFPKISWSGWEVFSIWFIAIAAAIPVASVGFRAWSAAFELCRKAKSFSAKDKAMQKADVKLQASSTSISEILIHLEHDELFLEQEHRDWLRALLDAEWFV